MKFLWAKWVENSDEANVLNKMEEANKKKNEIFTYNFDMSISIFMHRF